MFRICTYFVIFVLFFKANKAKNYISCILNKYSDGKVVFNYYESIGTLSQYIRNSLSSIIIKHEIQQCIKIDKNKFSLLAKGIISEEFLVYFYCFTFLKRLISFNFKLKALNNYFHVRLVKHILPLILKIEITYIQWEGNCMINTVNKKAN